MTSRAAHNSKALYSFFSITRFLYGAAEGDYTIVQTNGTYEAAAKTISNMISRARKELREKNFKTKAVRLVDDETNTVELFIKISCVGT